jgi:negative modulator of initiation of replication
MKTVEIDDDLYEYFLRKVQKFGESLSDVIRRECGIKSTKSDNPRAGGHSSAATLPAGKPSKLKSYLSSPTFLVHADAVSKFLAILSWLWREQGPVFEVVTGIRGTKRRYFSKDPKELEDSGRSVMPKRIPESPYWVVSNNGTRLKKEIISDVMRVLGYTDEDKDLARDAIW